MNRLPTAGVNGATRCSSQLKTPTPRTSFIKALAHLPVCGDTISSVAEYILVVGTVKISVHDLPDTLGC
jgi:hypothetical protein